MARYLSKREQQIMELIYERDAVTANEVTDALPGSPANATVRKLLRILEEKGEISHTLEEGRFVYRSCTPQETAGRSALGQVVRTFFKGSVRDVVATLLDPSQADLSDEELEELKALIADRSVGR
jgi:predicted transcriptional regulator